MRELWTKDALEEYPFIIRILCNMIPLKWGGWITKATDVNRDPLSKGLTIYKGPKINGGYMSSYETDEGFLQVFVIRGNTPIPLEGRNILQGIYDWGDTPDYIVRVDIELPVMDCYNQLVCAIGHCDVTIYSDF